MREGNTKITVGCLECGHEVELEVHWWDYPAYTPLGEFSPIDPPDSGFELLEPIPAKCTACGHIPSDKELEFLETQIENRFWWDENQRYNAKWDGGGD